MHGTARPHGPTPLRGSGRAPSRTDRTRTRARLRAAAAPLAAGGVTVAAVTLVATVDPHRPGSYGVCPVYALTGLYCAGCGGLRATYDLVHGDLAGAWAMNPVWVLLVPVLVALWVAWLARRWALPDPEGAAPELAAAGPDRSTGPAVRRVLPWAVLALVLLYSLARNLPGLGPVLAP